MSRGEEKTQDGIETSRPLTGRVRTEVAARRKPRTGLKRSAPGPSRDPLDARGEEKTQNGIETRRRWILHQRDEVAARRKPRTGLKLTHVVLASGRRSGRGEKKTQNGIETRSPVSKLRFEVVSRRGENPERD